MTSTMDGGMICPSVPDAQMVPQATELPGSFQLISRKMDEETLIYLGSAFEGRMMPITYPELLV